jgi:AAHS family 4-hydroxybenzoate transporter-like MFS transporter
MLSAVCAIFTNCGQAGTLALATVSYPADIRGTAVGWAYAVGKIGNILAPLAGGYVLTLGWSVSKICSVNSLVGLFCAAMVLILGLHLSSTAQYRDKAAAAA